MPRSRKLPLAWLAAAAVLALLLTNLYWFFRVNDLTQQRNQLTALLNGQGNKAFVLTGTDNLRWVRLPPSQEDSNTSAFMMWNERSDVGLLYAHAFPALTPGRTYQLWLTNGKERISAGTFHVDEEGKGAMLFHINEPIDGYTWARITAEPDSGSNAPSDSVVVIGELPSS